MGKNGVASSEQKIWKKKYSGYNNDIRRIAAPQHSACVIKNICCSDVGFVFYGILCTEQFRALMVCGLCIFERGDLKVAKKSRFA